MDSGQNPVEPLIWGYLDEQKPLTLFGLRGQGSKCPLRIFVKYLKNDLADLHETL